MLKKLNEKIIADRKNVTLTMSTVFLFLSFALFENPRDDLVNETFFWLMLCLWILMAYCYMVILHFKLFKNGK